jgi:hypothetical protein
MKITLRVLLVLFSGLLAVLGTTHFCCPKHVRPPAATIHTAAPSSSLKSLALTEPM